MRTITMLKKGGWSTGRPIDHPPSTPTARQNPDLLEEREASRSGVPLVGRAGDEAVRGAEGDHPFGDRRHHGDDAPGGSRVAGCREWVGGPPGGVVGPARPLRPSARRSAGRGRARPAGSRPPAIASRCGRRPCRKAPCRSRSSSVDGPSHPSDRAPRGRWPG